ncbi:hypothetical protein LY76DRAFT_545012 [Colletotrichum caudatum]|nr:hypothetical protein LY76DRAFT_545012 [Colletotrichum caudatum]
MHNDGMRMQQFRKGEAPTPPSRSFEEPWTTPTTEERQLKPWKYSGYNVFSRLLASDQDFLVVRRFGHVRSRLLLWLQDSVVRLEEELDHIDQQCSNGAGPDFNNGSFREEPVGRRAEVLQELHKALKDYDEHVLRCSQLCSLPKAEGRDIESIENWFLANPGAIGQSESSFISHKEDLVSIVPKIKSPLRRALERVSGFDLSPLFSMRPSGDFYDPELTRYYNDRKIEKFITAIVVTTGFLMLVAPLWILVFVAGELERLGVISAFVALFLALVSTVTVAKPFDTLAATAAYTAVLMVFMQIDYVGNPST